MPIFVCGSVIECNTLLSRNDKPCIVFDFEDSISTTILASNNGIVNMKSVNLGLNSILQQYIDKFNIDFNMAKTLLERAFATPEKFENVNYQVEDKLIALNDINSIVRQFIDEILESINKFLKGGIEEKPSTNIYLTGQIEKIKGMVGYMEMVTINKEVKFKVLTNDIKQYNKPENNTIISLMKFATEIY